MAARSPLIAVLDHDVVLLRLMESLLQAEGFRTLPLRDTASALPIIRRERPDILMLDTWVEDAESGWRLLRRLLANPDTRRIPLLVCSSDAQVFDRQTRILGRAERVEVVPKPFDTDALLEKLRSLLGEPPGHRPDTGKDTESPGRNAA
jgi:CheY-like chemotaxis protein